MTNNISGAHYPEVKTLEQGMTRATYHRPRLYRADIEANWYLPTEERAEGRVLMHDVSHDLKAYILAIYSMGLRMKTVLDVKEGFPKYRAWVTLSRQECDAAICQMVIDNQKPGGMALKRTESVAEMVWDPQHAEICMPLAHRIDHMRDTIYHAHFGLKRQYLPIEPNPLLVVRGAGIEVEDPVPQHHGTQPRAAMDEDPAARPADRGSVPAGATTPDRQNVDRGEGTAAPTFPRSVPAGAGGGRRRGRLG